MGFVLSAFVLSEIITPRQSQASQTQQQQADNPRLDQRGQTPYFHPKKVQARVAVPAPRSIARYCTMERIGERPMRACQDISKLCTRANDAGEAYHDHRAHLMLARKASKA